MFVANTAQVYLAAFLQLIPFPAKVQEEIVPILPLWGLVTFGAYLLFSLGWGVATFKDTEGAYHELMKVRSVSSQWPDSLQRGGRYSLRSYKTDTG